MVKYLSIIIFSILVGFIVFVLTVPKFLILDKLAMKNGIFLIADSVKETPLSINLKNSSIYIGDDMVLKGADIQASVILTGLSVKIKCDEKLSYLNISFSKNIKAKFNNLTCVTAASQVEGDLYTKDGVFGKMALKDIKAQGRTVRNVDIDFKGNIFNFKADVEGINVAGSGNISYNRDNPMDSKINAVASSLGFNFIISGSLINPKITLK
ncbi:MAG: hypothetical protein N2Z81_07315 [Hydrogenothermaceae bacterium]|nr:hypothetical protein [Hydrogenothermaceae bacterium]